MLRSTLLQRVLVVSLIREELESDNSLFGCFGDRMYATLASVCMRNRPALDEFVQGYLFERFPSAFRLKLA